MKVIALIALLVIYCNTISAKDITVDQNSPNAVQTSPCGSSGAPCATISAAIESAQSGDRILIAAGVYAGDLNVNLVINVAGLQIVGVAQLTILDLGLNAHAFLVLQPNVLFVNLIIKNGVSLDANIAGAITVRLNLPLLGAAVALQNVLFKDILGGALLLDCGGSSSPSNPSSPSTGNSGSSPSSPSNGIVVQAQLLNVVFVNIAVKPALTILGNVQVQLSNCQFQSNGLASLNVSATTGASGDNNGNVVGASIYAAANVLGLKVTLTLRACVFLNNLGVSIINIGSQLSGDELIFIDVNSFIGNVATTAVINTNPTLSLVTCLGCNTIWTNNVTPLLCAVSCGLLGISLLCPGSCPPGSGLLGGIRGIL